MFWLLYAFRRLSAYADESLAVKVLDPERTKARCSGLP